MAFHQWHSMCLHLLLIRMDCGYLTSVIVALFVGSDLAWLLQNVALPMSSLVPIHVVVVWCHHLAVSSVVLVHVVVVPDQRLAVHVEVVVQDVVGMVVMVVVAVDVLGRVVPQAS